MIIKRVLWKRAGYTVVLNTVYIACNRAFQSAVWNSGQKMALRAFYFIRALTYYYINRSQRYLLVAIENNSFGGPIEQKVASSRWQMHCFMFSRRPFVVLYGFLWHCMALHCFVWSFMAFFMATCWFGLILSFLAVIDPNSFGLVSLGPTERSEESLRCDFAICQYLHCIANINGSMHASYLINF